MPEPQCGVVNFNLYGLRRHINAQTTTSGIAVVLNLLLLLHFNDDTPPNKLYIHI